MSMILSADQENLGQVATNSGWYDFIHMDNLEGPLDQLCEDGWWRGSGELRDQLIGMIKEWDDTPDRLEIAQGIVDMLKDVDPEAVIIVSDGLTSGDDSDEDDSDQ